MPPRAADDRGELVSNGKQYGKDHVKQFVNRIVWLKEKMIIAAGPDVYINGVIVFPKARVDARWGRTRSVDCLRLEKICDYISEYKGRQLSAGQVSAIAEVLHRLHTTRGPHKSS